MQLSKHLTAFLCVIYLVLVATRLEGHDHVVVYDRGHHWGPHERVYVGDPWYHHDHVYMNGGYAYPRYYYGYPYYYYDPSYYYYGPSAPGVNINVHIP